MLADEGGSGLFVHLLNESPVDRQLQLEVCVWRGGDVLVAAASKDCPLAAHATQSLSCVELFDHFIDLTHAYRFGPPVCDAVVATLYDEDGHQLAQTFYFPQGLSELQERDAALNAEAVALDSQTVQVTLTAKRLAVGVHFDAMGYAADNEFFHLAPNSKKQIILRSNRPRTLSGVVCSINAMADVPLKCIQC